MVRIEQLYSEQCFKECTYTLQGSVAAVAIVAALVALVAFAGGRITYTPPAPLPCPPLIPVIPVVPPVVPVVPPPVPVPAITSSWFLGPLPPPVPPPLPPPILPVGVPPPPPICPLPPTTFVGSLWYEVFKLSAISATSGIGILIISAIARVAIDRIQRQRAMELEPGFS